MPTEILRRVVVEGPPAALAHFRADEGLREVEPWTHMYGMSLDDSAPGRLVYRYNEDFKRPGPSVARMSAAHPELVLQLETCDEFGERAVRTRFTGGVAVERTVVDPYQLDWIEWEGDEE